VLDAAALMLMANGGHTHTNVGTQWADNAKEGNQGFPL
jgi:hypothetical protein